MNYNEYLNDTNPQIAIDMDSLGTIKLELFPTIAPISVENFLSLVDSSFYDGIIFHRVIKGFMIQGGDPLGTGYGGSSSFMPMFTNQMFAKFAGSYFTTNLAPEGVISVKLRVALALQS